MKTIFPLLGVLLLSASFAQAAPSNYTFRYAAKGVVETPVAPNPVPPAGTTFATWSPTAKSSDIQLSSDKLTMFTYVQSQTFYGLSTVGKDSGKWYWEVTVNYHMAYPYAGISNGSRTFIAEPGSGPGGSWLVGATKGPAFNYGLYSNVGDTLMFALDLDAKTLTVGKNGSWGATATTAAASFSAAPPTITNIPAGTIYPSASLANASQMQANFGKTAFKYQPPNGYMQGVW